MDTIINVVKPADYTLTSPAPPGETPIVFNMVHPSAPPNSTFEKEPNSYDYFRSPVEKRSFKKIKKDGTIAMTPHVVLSTITENSVVGLKGEAVTIRSPHTYYYPGPSCWYNPGQINLVTTWTKQGDFRFWSNVGTIDHIYLNELPDITSAVRSTQSSAVAAFKSGYDLLTELAEGRETLAFFASTSRSASEVMKKLLSEVDPNDFQRALKGRYTPKKLLKSADRGLRNLGSKWMAYRYAIMPLFYSFQDVKKLVEERGLLFKTFRQREKFELNTPTPPSGEIDTTMFSFYTGQIEVNSTVKAGYSKEGLQSLVANQIGINPLATAYELVPLSFVLDWIVNMGDWIVSHTSLDFSQQSAMCTSIREKLVLETVMMVDKVVTSTIVVGGAGDPCIPVTTTLSYDSSFYSVNTLRKKHINNYQRFLFTAADVRLTLNSSMMNWKRYVDAAVLSNQNLRNLLKKITKK